GAQETDPGPTQEGPGGAAQSSQLFASRAPGVQVSQFTPALINAMSLNPSNAISERIAGIKPFKNMAGVGYQYPELVDDTLADELRAAGIHIAALPERYGEPHSTIAGELFGWEFRRAWYYWIVIGPGLPFDVATKLYEAYGKSVRVNGHCGCPSPAEEGGVPVTSYHVDNQEGLNALAATIISLNTKTDRPMPNPEKIAKFKTAHQLARELLA